MKVHELIAKLERLNQNADVIVAIGEDSRDNIVWGFVSGARTDVIGEMNDEYLDTYLGEDEEVVILSTEQ